MSQFYAITHEATERVPQFIIYFQNLRKQPQFVIRFQILKKQLTRSPTPEEFTETFLISIWEPLRTTLAVVDLIGKPIEDVISRVLRLTCDSIMYRVCL